MNRYKFIIKFIANKNENGKYKWNLLFPFAGVIIGCMTVALTLSIMEGMEYAIFTKLKDISFPGKLENISTVETNDLTTFLQANEIIFQKGIEDQVMILKGEHFRLVTIHGVEKLNQFKDKVFVDNMLRLEGSVKNSQIYIGRSLAVKLDVSFGDTVLIMHPKNINIFTGLPNRMQMIISGLFKLNIIDYDQHHIFRGHDFYALPFSNVSSFLKKSYIFLLPNLFVHLFLSVLLFSDENL